MAYILEQQEEQEEKEEEKLNNQRTVDILIWLQTQNQIL
jgi:hypothetical protein